MRDSLVPLANCPRIDAEMASFKRSFQRRGESLVRLSCVFIFTQAAQRDQECANLCADSVESTSWTTTPISLGPLNNEEAYVVE